MAGFQHDSDYRLLYLSYKNDTMLKRNQVIKLMWSRLVFLSRGMGLSTTNLKVCLFPANQTHGFGVTDARLYQSQY